jgi:hypothetical protein
MEISVFFFSKGYLKQGMTLEEGNIRWLRIVHLSRFPSMKNIK